MTQQAVYANRSPRTSICAPPGESGVKFAPDANSKLFYVISFFMMLTVVAIFVPFLPLMPQAGLDQSWILAMNRAVVDGVANDVGRKSVFIDILHCCSTNDICSTQRISNAGVHLHSNHPDLQRRPS
jgi:hypothetical protein